MQKKLLLLLWLFCLHGLAAQQESRFTSEEVIAIYNQASQNLARANYLRLSRARDQQYLSYKMILVQQGNISEQQTNSPPKSNSETSEFMNLLNSQMQNLLTLEIQWQVLEEHYRRQSVYNKELLNLLDESKQTIALLRWNLECALERIQDAEDGAIALLDENAEIFQQARLAIANIANMQRELAKSRRGAVIGWTVGSISFGVGMPLIVEGVRTDNQAMIWSGVGVACVDSLVWATGHFFFQWW